MNKLFLLYSFLHVVNKLIDLRCFNKITLSLKNVVKMFLHSFQTKGICRYNCTMPPVMGVRTTLSNIPGTRKHIWLKVFSNKPMQECRDVRKSQVSTTENKKVIAV